MHAECSSLMVNPHNAAAGPAAGPNSVALLLLCLQLLEQKLAGLQAELRAVTRS